MKNRMFWLVAALGVCGLAGWAISVPNQPVKNNRPELNEQKRFWVYEDSHLNLWKAANWMPQEATTMIKVFDPNCEENPKFGKRCIRVRIEKWTEPNWCGVAWAIPNPKDPAGGYWGEEPAPGWDLRGAKRVVFWARAPKPCRVQFKAAIIGDKPYGDSAASPAQTDWLSLTPEWKEYTIDLKNVDLSRVITGFCFVTNRDAQSERDAAVDFYLDQIYWDFGAKTEDLGK